MWSVATYASETWTMKTEDKRKVEALEMWIWRKCENISWRDKTSNDEVLRRVNEERGMLKAITKRKKSWVGSILSREGLMKDALEGRMEGKRQQGRPRQQMLDDIIENGYKDFKDSIHQ